MAVVIKYAQTQKDHIIADVKRVIIWPMMSTHALMLTSVTATVTIQKLSRKSGKFRKLFSSKLLTVLS